MEVKVTYKSGEVRIFKDVIGVRYNYNGEGDIKVRLGKYLYSTKWIMINDVETISIH